MKRLNFVNGIKLIGTSQPSQNQRKAGDKASRSNGWSKFETVNSTPMKVADRTENEPMKSDESSTKRNIFTRLTPIVSDTRPGRDMVCETKRASRCVQSNEAMNKSRCDSVLPALLCDRLTFTISTQYWIEEVHPALIIHENNNKLGGSSL